MINRRSLLALFGGAAAAPSSIGAKTAAKLLGVDLHPPAPMPVEQSCAIAGDTGGQITAWWGSKAQIALDARRAAIYEASSQDRYAHMKSWGPAFKRSVVEREIQAERMLEHKAQIDRDFFNKLLGL